MQPQSKYITPAIAAALALGLFVGLEAVDVKVEHNKTFDFKAVRDLGLESQGRRQRHHGPHAGGRCGGDESVRRPADPGCRGDRLMGRSAASGSRSPT